MNKYGHEWIIKRSRLLIRTKFCRTSLLNTKMCACSKFPGSLYCYFLRGIVFVWIEFYCNWITFQAEKLRCRLNVLQNEILNRLSLSLGLLKYSWWYTRKNFKRILNDEVCFTVSVEVAENTFLKVSETNYKVTIPIAVVQAEPSLWAMHMGAVWQKG